MSNAEPAWYRLADLPPLPKPSRPHDSPVTFFLAHTDGFYTPGQMRAYGEACAAAERKACARIAATPFVGEQDDITMAAKDRVAAAIRARGETCDAGPWGPCPTPNACKCPPREGK